MELNPNDYITFVIQNQQHRLNRNNFFSATKLSEEKRNIKKSALPEWVTPSLFAKIQLYIETQDISRVDPNNTEQLQKLLWLGDILYLEGFQEVLIRDKIINNMTPGNCVVFLLESHKKLRNSEKSLSCWYNLLNSSMTYIANNMLQLYPRIQGDMKKLNEKILAEILERTVKNLKKNNYETKDEIFKIIMEVKEVKDVGRLCQDLKEIVKKKKINPQIHANLSWKLSNLMAIDVKKTKVFKFIDYEWRLQAIATPGSKKQLNISLVLESRQSDSSSSAGSQFVEDFQLKGETLSGFAPVITSGHSSSSNKQDLRCHNDFQRLGVLYLKLVSKIDEVTYETDVRVNYLNIEEKESIELLEFNEAQLYDIGSKKIEITLYCSLENVYTFVLNYLLQSYDFTQISLELLCLEELALLARFLTKDSKEQQACHIIMYLLNSKKASEEQIRPLVLGLDYRSQSKQVLANMSDLLVRVGYSRLQEQLMGPFKEVPLSLHPEQQRVAQLPVLDRIPSIQKSAINENKHPAEFQSQADLTLSKGRGDSKQRLKKIFQSPIKKSSNLVEQQREQQKRRIQQELDIRKFIFVQDSAFCKAFNDLLR